MHIVKFKNTFSIVKYKSYFHERHFPILEFSRKLKTCFSILYLIFNLMFVHSVREIFRHCLSISQQQGQSSDTISQ